MNCILLLKIGGINYCKSSFTLLLTFCRYLLCRHSSIRGEVEQVLIGLLFCVAGYAQDKNTDAKMTTLKKVEKLTCMRICDH